MGLRLTEQEYADLKARLQAPPVPVIEKSTQPKQRQNKTEIEYGQLLEARKRMGEIKDYGFERIKLRLADAVLYIPDYDVVLDDGTIEMHEVKGFMRDDARIKIYTAARMYPHIKFWLIKKRAKKDGGGFSAERIWP